MSNFTDHTDKFAKTDHDEEMKNDKQPSKLAAFVTMANSGKVPSELSESVLMYTGDGHSVPPVNMDSRNCINDRKGTVRWQRGQLSDTKCRQSDGDNCCYVECPDSDTAEYANKVLTKVARKLNRAGRDGKMVTIHAEEDYALCQMNVLNNLRKNVTVVVQSNSDLNVFNENLNKVLEFGMPSLHTLYVPFLLFGGKISGEGAKALAAINLVNLTSLRVTYNSIGDDGAKALANGNLTNLTSLDVSNNDIGDDGAKALANGNLTNLTSLEVHENRIGGEGAKALAAGNLVNLTSLDVRHNQIGAEGAKALAAGNLVSLTSLNVSYNNIGGKP